MCVYIYVCPSMFMCVYAVFMCVCIYVCMYVYTHMHICMYVCACIYVCMCACALERCFRRNRHPFKLEIGRRLALRILERVYGEMVVVVVVVCMRMCARGG